MELHHVLLILLSVFIIFINSIIISLQTNLYPDQVAQRHLPGFYSAIVLATHEVTLLIISPVCAWLVYYMKEKYSLLSACLISAGACIAFSVLNSVTNVSIFLALSIIIKIVQAMGHSLLCISLFTHLLSELSKYKSLAIASCLSFFTVGIVISSNLALSFAHNNLFTLPLSLLGLVMAILAVVSQYIIPTPTNNSDYTEQLQKSGFNFVTLLKIPDVWVGIFTTLVCTMNPFYLIDSLTPPLEELGLSSVSCILMILGLCFSLSTLVWGFGLDKGFNPIVCICTSSITICLSVTFIQSYFLWFPVWLIITCLIMSGIAWSALTISGLAQMVNTARAAGLPIIVKLYAMIISIWQSSFAVRSGLIYQAFGFRFGNLIVAVSTIMLFLVTAAMLFSTSRVRKLSLRKISWSNIVEQCEESKETVQEKA